MTPVVLALSPHLDDAAFSCGGVLATLSEAGVRVIVATVFTRSVPDPQGFALACQLDKGLSPDVDYMALRREEDAVALRQLGAEPLWLDFPEAPHRGYASAAALFASRRADDGVVAALVPLLESLLARIAPVLILGPRCVGNHVDHHAVRDALAAIAPQAPVALWTDHPYALRHGDGAADIALHAVALTPETLDRKILAACGYASQIGFQYGGPDGLRHAMAGVTRELFEAAPDAARRLDDLVAPAVPA